MLIVLFLRFQNHLANTGLGSQFGLKKRGDRWNVYEVEYIELPPPPHWKTADETDKFWKTAALFEEVHSLTDYRDTATAAGLRAGGASSFLTQQQHDHRDINTIDEEGEIDGGWGQQVGFGTTDNADMVAVYHDYGSISNESFMQEGSLEDATEASVLNSALAPVSRAIRVTDEDAEPSKADTEMHPSIVGTSDIYDCAASTSKAVNASSSLKRKPAKGLDTPAESSKGSSVDSSTVDSSGKKKHSINWFIRQYTSNTSTYESALTRSSRSGGIGRKGPATNTGGIALSDIDRSLSSGDSIPSLPSITIRKEASSSVTSHKKDEQDAGRCADGKLRPAGRPMGEVEQILSGSKVPEQILSGSKVPEQVLLSGSKVPEQVLLSGSKVPEQILLPGSRVPEHGLDEESTSHLSLSSNESSSIVSFNNNNPSPVNEAQAEEKARYAEIVRHFDREENKRYVPYVH